jgi:hypothetical protein
VGAASAAREPFPLALPPHPQIIHANVIDTALLFPHPRGPPFKSALRVLASRHLLRTIQQGERWGENERGGLSVSVLQRTAASTCPMHCSALSMRSSRSPATRPRPLPLRTRYPRLAPPAMHYSKLTLSFRLPLIPHPHRTPPGEHNPVEDARAALDLALLKFTRGPAYGVVSGERGERLTEVLSNAGRWGFWCASDATQFCQGASEGTHGVGCRRDPATGPASEVLNALGRQCW